MHNVYKQCSVNDYTEHCNHLTEPLNILEYKLAI